LIVEELIRETELKEFYRSGSIVYGAQRRANGNGRVFELLEYGVGGRRSSIVTLEGNEERGWTGCAVQLTKVVSSFAPSRSGNEKVYGGVPPATQLLEEGRQMFVEALSGKGQEKEIENLSTDNLGHARN
jgi:hypothetical protein